MAGHDPWVFLKTIGQVATSDKQTVEVSCRSAAITAKTAAMTADNTGYVWTTVNIGPANGPQRTVLDDVPTITELVFAAAGSFRINIV